MIWKRFIFKEIIKIFALVLFGFFFLYSAMDYSFHMQDFLKDKKIQLSDFFLYYTHLFIKRCDLLVPLAMLISTIKVLSTLNAQRELLALQVAGLNFKKICRPFFMLAAACSLFSYASVEFFLPNSLNYLDNFHNDHFRHGDRGHRKTTFRKKEKLHVIPLKDRSKIIYQYFDKEKEAYFDVYWIRSGSDIWRIKYLKNEGENPEGKYVDHFKRTSEGFLEKAESFENYLFKELKWTQDTTGADIPYENRRTSELWRMAHKPSTKAYEKSEIMTDFFFKCTMPLLPFLAFIALAPFCIRYSRNQNTFFTYAFGIFGYIAFFLLMNAVVILGENNVLSPLTAVVVPFAICSFIFGWKFYKTV